jgi:hypothetical protein
MVTEAASLLPCLRSFLRTEGAASHADWPENQWWKRAGSIIGKASLTCHWLQSLEMPAVKRRLPSFAENGKARAGWLITASFAPTLQPETGIATVKLR